VGRARVPAQLPRPGDADAVAQVWSPKDYARLQQVKAAYDPAELLRHGHRIPPARVPAQRGADRAPVPA
jgi:FAD/FMN-containing dehydrogenase